MRILVQKFGGTSVSNPEAREHVIRHIKKALNDEYKLVVVVSAMGRRGEPYATDTLLDLVSQNGSFLPEREKDLLLYCGEMISAVTLCSLLHAEGISTTVFNGAQAGILTDDQFGNARILSVQPAKVLEQLEKGQVVVVTGFQGRTAQSEITTLGRGGSDTTATALGVALQAEIVDIFTDVDGILTADPKIVEDATQISQVTFTEICNMAYNGAKVIHPRAVEIAMQANMPVRVRSTFSDAEGTLVTSRHDARDTGAGVGDRFVTAIAHSAGVTQIRVSKPEGLKDFQPKVFRAMADNGISIDFINVNPEGLEYTVPDSVADKALRLLEELGCAPDAVSHCAKVSAIGGGINGVPGIMAWIVEALAAETVTILQSADSNTTIWVLVRGEDMVKAVKALHRKFLLHEALA
ncbi:aspartate kinase [Gorillibacterium massiliense]|uniref:aspartate kinase n=1 Tax=Gorillibacterium massiliense TaxID=1280390 RepID=UPI0004AE54A3|nr:aspartate kinase [Gorillibacterium massiliense]